MSPRNWNRLVLLLSGAIALFALGCGGAEAKLPATPDDASSELDNKPLSTISESEAMIWLEAPTGSHQTGWAHLWEEADRLYVEVDVSPASAVAQPAHIHQGDCTMLGVIDFRLENIVGGHSLTELQGVTLEELATGNLAINLHASFADFSTFTACGAIPVVDAPAQSSPAEPPVKPFSESEFGSEYGLD